MNMIRTGNTISSVLVTRYPPHRALYMIRTGTQCNPYSVFNMIRTGHKMKLITLNKSVKMSTLFPFLLVGVPNFADCAFAACGFTACGLV